ncbi:MAG: TetR family transcriptional regulator [Frankiales bacterium]|nr:TetR family transcriptional regulator [Frankiales bacterium]
MSTAALSGPTVSALLPPTPEMSDARRRVFEAAIVLFGRSGYHAVSVRDIAAELGLKPMALYAHVASKQELLYELVKLGFATHRDRMSAALLEVSADPLEQIRALCEAHVRVHLDYPALARVTNRETESLDEQYRPALQRMREDAARSFEEVVARGQRLKVFVDDDPFLIIQAIGGMGTRTPEWWSPGLGVPAETVVKTYADFALRILTGGTPA